MNKNEPLLVAALFAVSLASSSWSATPGEFAERKSVQSNLRIAVPQPAPAREYPETPALSIVIEYPSAITPNAIAVLRAYARSTFAELGKTRPEILQSDYIDQRTLDGINKSGFYAMKLYHELFRQAGVPDDSVALDPVIFDAESPGADAIFVRHVAELPPTVLRVRFTAFRGLLDVTDEDFTVYQNSFGLYFAPKFVAFSEPAAWPSTRGVALGTFGTFGGVRSLCTTDNCLDATAIALPDFGRPHEFCVMPGHQKTEAKIIELRYPKAVVLPELMLNEPLTPTPESIGGAQRLAALLAAAYRQTDPYLGTIVAWKRYLARLDPELARHWPTPHLDTADSEKLAWIRKIMLADRKLAARSSRDAVDYALFGAPGERIRDQLLAEQDLMLKMRTAHLEARSASLSNLVGYLSSQYSSQAAGGSAFSIQGWTQAQQFVEKASSIERQQSRSLQALRSAFADVYQRSSNAGPMVTQEFTLEAHTITAASSEELKDKASKIYATRFKGPSDADAEKCPKEFVVKRRLPSPIAVTYRNWSGKCKAGEPVGQGYVEGFLNGVRFSSGFIDLRDGYEEGPSFGVAGGALDRDPNLPPNGFRLRAGEDRFQLMKDLEARGKSCLNTGEVAFGAFGKTVQSVGDGPMIIWASGLEKIVVMKDDVESKKKPKPDEVSAVKLEWERWLAERHAFVAMP